MCGRFVRTSPREAVVDEFAVDAVTVVDLRPRYNICPGDQVVAIVQHRDERRLGTLRWGFHPTLATQRPLPPAGILPINARAETVASKPLFHDSFRRRRCLIVADGFYEWRRAGRVKVPHFILCRSKRPFAFAGLWWPAHLQTGQASAVCTILTCAANELVAPIHDRMPVILPAQERDQWLDPSTDPVELERLLVSLPTTEMAVYEVSILVNSPKNDSPECIRRVTS